MISTQTNGTMFAAPARFSINVLKAILCIPDTAVRLSNSKKKDLLQESWGLQLSHPHVKQIIQGIFADSLWCQTKSRYL